MFLLFTGLDYYPAGGWGDFKGAFDTEAEAMKAAANLANDWWQVVRFPNSPALQAYIVASGPDD